MKCSAAWSTLPIDKQLLPETVPNFPVASNLLSKLQNFPTALNIRWQERVDEENRPRAFDPHGTQQTVPLKATLPRRVPEWESTSTSKPTRANRQRRARMSTPRCEMCRAVLEEKPTYGLLRHLQHQKQQPRNQPTPIRTEFGDATFLAGLGVVLGVVLRELY
jgi:hypothetical protein